MVNIEGLDKAEVLRYLYNASHVQGMGYLQARKESMTRDEAASILERTTYIDYLYGKVMKINFESDYSFDERLYDRDNGQGAAQKVIDNLRAEPKSYTTHISRNKVIQKESDMEVLNPLLWSKHNKLLVFPTEQELSKIEKNYIEGTEVTIIIYQGDYAIMSTSIFDLCVRDQKDNTPVIIHGSSHRLLIRSISIRFEDIYEVAVTGVLV